MEEASRAERINALDDTEEDDKLEEGASFL